MGYKCMKKHLGGCCGGQAIKRKTCGDMALCPAHYHASGNSVNRTGQMYADGLTVSKVPINKVPTGDYDTNRGHDHMLKIVTRPLAAGGTGSGWWSGEEVSGHLRWVRGTVCRSESVHDERFRIHKNLEFLCPFRFNIQETVSRNPIIFMVKQAAGTVQCLGLV